MKSTPENNLCHPRKPFNSEEAARTACFHIAQTQKIQKYPEYCQKCKKWHLTGLK